MKTAAIRKGIGHGKGSVNNKIPVGIKGIQGPVDLPNLIGEILSVHIITGISVFFDPAFLLFFALVLLIRNHACGPCVIRQISCGFRILRR